MLTRDEQGAPAAEISRRLDEPEWLRARRAAAWRLYLDTPPPGPREESWRRFPAGQVRPEGALAFAPPADPGPAPAPAGEAGLLVQRDSAVTHRWLDPALAAAGVLFDDLGAAARLHPELFQRYFMTELVLPGENCFTALHAALWSGGAFLYVPPGVAVTAPFRYAVTATRPDLALFDHLLVIAGAGSRLTLLQTLAAEHPGAPRFQCGAVEVVAGEGAQVHLGTVQRWRGETVAFAFRRALVGRGARLEWTVGELGGRLVRSETQSLLYGEGGRSRTTLTYLAADGAHVDVGAAAVHAAPATESDTEARGAVAGGGRAVYRGLGHILRGARGAVLDQRQRALLLGPDARSDSIPSLLIEEHDVRAGHAAAASPPDPEQLFYLMSRGLTAAEARRLLVRAFFQPLLAGLDLPALRAPLEEELARRLAAVAAAGGEGGGL